MYFLHTYIHSILIYVIVPIKQFDYICTVCNHIISRSFDIHSQKFKAGATLDIIGHRCSSNITSDVHLSVFISFQSFPMRNANKVVITCILESASMICAFLKDIYYKFAKIQLTKIFSLQKIF